MSWSAFACHNTEAVIMDLPASHQPAADQAVSVEQFLSLLSESGLLPAEEAKAAAAKVSRTQQRDSRALAQELVKQQKLTRYQATLLCLGKSKGLVLGNYVVLDRIGVGGMGEVFKARHQSLNRVVALKVLRPELVSDGEAVSRFYREVKIASQLPEHPNLVRAFDAGPLGPSHFLSMEYVAGIDLDRLVKQAGPLPIEQACGYLRQAALGLQHAHQHGLVHRDIKPSNLLVAQVHGATPVIKILDLGLARLQANGSQSSRENTFMTTDGPVTLGTVDYQAPEQALDFHRADIRADIYSLGCSSYFLLTGKPPFGSGPLAIKLMRHQQAEPPDLQALRADVPDGLAAIVRRMLAKRPADRYQTPAEVADALRSPAPAAIRTGRGPATGLFRRALAAGLRFVGGCGRLAWRQGRAHPRVALTVLAILLLLAGGFAVFQSLEEVRRENLLQIRRERPGTAAALAAAVEFMKLPSPLDRLDPRAIPPESRLAGDPKELVAVLGQPGQKRVQSVAFSPDGSLLACGDSDHQVRLWATATGEELAILKGHTAAVFALAFSPDGKTLASGGGDVRFWDVATRAELAGQKPTSNHRPACLAYSPDGKTLAVAYGGSGAVMLWDLATGQARATLKGPSTMVFSLGFAADGETVAVASYQRPVVVWNVADGTERPPVSIDNAYCLAYAADGQTLVVIGPDDQMRLWDIASNRERARGSIGVRYDRLALSPDASKAVTTTSGGGVAVWSLPVVAKLQQWKLPFSVAVQYHFTYVPAFAPDGRHLAVAGDDGKVYIFRLTPPIMD